MKPFSFNAPVHLLLLPALLFGLPALASPSTAGATFVVDTSVDEVDVSPGDGLCAGPSGGCTLRAAVMEANALVGPDEIYLPGGPAAPAPSLNITGVGEDASLTGDLDVLDDLTISGDGMALSGAEASALGDRALHVHPGVNLVLSGVSFFWPDAGSGQDGGGLLNEGTVSMVEASFQAGRAARGAGVMNRGKLTLVRSVVAYNTASDAGGGIGNEGTLEIQQSTIAGNQVSAGPGGAIDNHATLHAFNTTLSQNRASHLAAALYNAPGASAVLNNVTLFANAVPFGEPASSGAGGVFNAAGGFVRLGNSILAVNAFGAGYDQADCMGSIESAGHNLFGSLAGCSLSGDLSGNLVGLDPMLEPLGSLDPAQTWGHPPRPGSPAIDAGSPAVPGSGGGACEPGDQRGRSRPVGPACDIGSYEVESPGPTATVFRPTPTAPPSPTATDTPSPTLTSTPGATPSVGALFADDFESGGLSAWAYARSDGTDLTVSTEAALQGLFGLRVLVHDNRPAFVVDETPHAETAYRARFAFDPDGLSIGTGKAFVLFQGRRSSGLVAFQIEVRRVQGKHQLRAVAPQAGGQAYATPWVPLLAGPQTIEIAWWAAASARDRNGGIALRVDDHVVNPGPGLRNFGRVVDLVRLGSVTGASRGTRGVFYLDAFASTDGAPIGEHP